MTSDAAAEFEAHRGRLFGLAYRLLGSAADAEDAVQDTYLRWAGVDRSTIHSLSAWLTTALTNLCLNRLTSARVQRERYVGTWLPEPVLTADGALGSQETAGQRDLVSMGLLLLLERLSPAERAVFVLREAFGHSYREIADIVGLSEVNCRQVQRRARERIGARPGRFVVDRAQWQLLVEHFLAAAAGQDLAALERLLAAEVTYIADGGGVAPVARRPVSGRARVARLVAGLLATFGGDVQVSLPEVNGEPAIVGSVDGALVGVLALSIVAGQVVALRTVANPAKLAFAARQIAALSHR